SANRGDWTRCRNCVPPVTSNSSTTRDLTGARRFPRVSTLTLMDLVPLNGFSVFLGIAAVGFLFLMVSLFFGEIFEHFDTAFDHDLDHGGPGFFSPRVMSVFVTTLDARV